MIKASNQVGLNMKVVLLSLRFKEIPILYHLEHRGASYDHLKVEALSSSNVQYLEFF